MPRLALFVLLAAFAAVTLALHLEDNPLGERRREVADAIRRPVGAKAADDVPNYVKQSRRVMGLTDEQIQRIAERAQQQKRV